MTSRLDISSPATLTVLAGNATLSSLGQGPGLRVSAPSPTDQLSVSVQAGNGAALLSASSLGGATVSGTGNSLTLRGDEAQVNAALASLELTEPVGTAGDVLSLSATDSAALSAQTSLAVDVVPLTGPAFVAPATLVTLHPNSLVALPDMLLSDPIASGLAAMGLGDEETLSLTLSVRAGVLELPGVNQLSGIAAKGLGTGTIQLGFTADEIGALNTLLAGLEFAGPTVTGGQHLDYSLWNASGVLPRELTYGNIFLYNVGTAALGGTFAAGNNTLIDGPATLTGTMGIGSTLSVLGNVGGGGAVSIAPDAALESPYNNIFLGGTSFDFGALAAVGLQESGTLLVGDGASFTGEVALSGSALLDFAGGTLAVGDAQTGGVVALSLASGAMLAGGGTLSAGNFANAGTIAGPGTIAALGGETLQIDAGLLTGGTDLAVGGGGVMVLGPQAPLFGIFTTTPLTIDNSVTLSFAGVGAMPVGGGYANPLGGAGGAFVINGPQVFSGTVTGFAPGDELIFPGLSNLSVYNIGAGSFDVSGLDASGTTDSYTIFSSIAAWLVPSAGTDAAGDSTVFLRPATAAISLAANLAASAGVAQPLPGISLNMPGSSTQSLVLTVSVGQGVLETGGLSPAASLVLTAANISALEADLAALTYTGNGLADMLSFTSNAGLLAGLQATATIAAGGTGTVSAYGGGPVTSAEMVAFGPAAGMPDITTPYVLGGAQVSGLVTFNDALRATGYSGTALVVEGGGQAVFGAAAQVALAGGVTLGDASGAGRLDVLTHDFSLSGDMVLAASAAGAGSEAAILGGLSAAGSLQIGLSGAAGLALGGTLEAAAATLGASGTLAVYGSAHATLGTVLDNGTLRLSGDATLAAASALGAGSIQLSGTALLDMTGAMAPQAGSLIEVGPGATLAAAVLSQSGGTILDSGLVTASGAVQLAALSLSGGELAAGSLQLDGLLAGNGEIVAQTVAGTGTLLAQGGRLLVAGSLAVAGGAELGPGATLELAGGESGAALSFAGADALAVLDNVAAGVAGVQHMGAGDAIDLVGVAPSLVSYSGGTNGVLDVLDTQGSLVASFSLQNSGAAPVTVISDGVGGSLLTLGGELPCFARGTGILTPHGYRSVEALRPGDPVITARGDRRPVRWVGWRTLDLGTEAARFARPVIVMPGAFGEGQPYRRLRLSPLHCVYVDGVLVPVTHLVNGATILRDMSAQATTYYHIELDRHDVVLAEGLSCETYFDNGNRGPLYRELGRRCPARKPCAPHVTGGPRLAQIRRRLHDIAVVAGFSTSFYPTLRVVAGGQELVPEITRSGDERRARLCFAQPVRRLILLSAASAPAETDPESEDRRELGICLGEMRGARLEEGWYPRAPGDAGTWMGAKGAIILPLAAREIVLPLAAIAQSWVRPQPVDAARRGR